MRIPKKALWISMLALALAGCGTKEKPVDTTAAAQSVEVTEAEENLSDEVIYGAIYTSDESNKTAEAMAIKDGKIVYVGDKAGADAFISGSTVVTDYKDNFIMPGFIDGHVHIYIDAENQAGFRFGESLEQTQEAYLKIVKEYIEANPELEIYKGFGWLDSAFIGGTPTAAMLDEICADKPIFIESEDCHSCWINTKMLEMTGVDADTPDPIGGKVEHDKDGKPNGCFRDTAMDSLVKPYVPIYSVDEYKDILLNAQDKMLSLGYTSMVDVIIDPQSADNICQAYYELDKEGQLKMKVNEAVVVNNTEHYVSDLEHVKELSDKYKGDHFQITDVKIFMDGIVESESAYVSQPYVGTDQYGADRWPGEEGTERLYDLAKRINDLGFVAHFHAIGDAAITKALDAIEYVRENSENKDIRNVITHLQMCSQEDIQRMAKLNVIASADLGWAPSLSEDLGQQNIELLNVGEERNNAMYPYRSMLEAGVTVAYATDYPAGPIIFPLINLPGGITRQHLGLESTIRNAEEGLTIDQALTAMTITGAYQMGRENETGSLEVGKSADFIVLDQNLTAIDPLEIYQTGYVAVYADGENVMKSTNPDPDMDFPSIDYTGFYQNEDGQAEIRFTPNEEYPFDVQFSVQRLCSMDGIGTWMDGAVEIMFKDPNGNDMCAVFFPDGEYTYTLRITQSKWDLIAEQTDFSGFVRTADPESAVINLKDGVLKPMDCWFDINEDLPHADLNVGFHAENFKANGDGIELKTGIYFEDLFDVADTAALKEGDKIVLGGESYEIYSKEEGKNGYDINGGLEKGGFELVSNGGGTYRYRGYDDISSYTYAGDRTFAVSKDCIFEDSSDLEKGTQEIPYSDLLAHMNKIKDTEWDLFTPYDTKLIVENNEIVKIERRYTP